MGHAELTLQDQATTRQISLDEYWMPFTPNREFKSDPRMIVRAEGMYCWSDKGAKIIDASSGLFCCAAGHGRREIAEAVGRQLALLDFSAPFLRGHPKQFELATRIAELTPGDLNRVFYGNSGSEAVDTAMKVALAYHQARGQGGRNVFVSRERAYHGVNFGGVSLSGLVNNRRKYGPGLPGIAHMRHTHLKENFFTQGEGAHGVELAEDLLRFVNLYGAENIAACFVEPIAGSTGCLVPPKGYLTRLREICDAHGILLVFDEVITAFGRTGQAFAAQTFGVTPDIITMAKALTNGAQPMSAVAVSERIHDTIMQRGRRGRDRVLSRLHLLRPSGRVRGGARDARHLPQRGPLRAGSRAVALLPGRDLLAARSSRGRRHSRLRHVRRDRRPRRRNARRARSRAAEEALRQWPQPQDDRRLRDHRAAADRGEIACRRDRGHPAQDAFRHLMFTPGARAGAGRNGKGEIQ